MLLESMEMMSVSAARARRASHQADYTSYQRFVTGGRIVRIAASVRALDRRLRTRRPPGCAARHADRADDCPADHERHADRHAPVKAEENFRPSGVAVECPTPSSAA